MSISLSPYEIPVVAGINDVPIPVDYNNNGRGCNGAYLIAQYNGLLSYLQTVINDIVVPSSDVSGDVAGTYPVLTLVDSGVTAGDYPNANITVDQKGRVTSASRSTYDIGGYIPSPQAQVYPLLKPSQARNLVQLRLNSGSGTGTVALSVDGVAVAGGSGISLSTSESIIVPSAPVLVSAGSRITLTISSPSLSLTNVEYTLTLG